MFGNIFSMFKKVQAPEDPAVSNEKKKLFIEQVKEDLRRDEGIVLHEYKDHLGYSTIGIGRLIDKRRGGGITMGEAEYLLSNDVLGRIDLLRKHLPWFDSKPRDVRRALLNMSFQMGIGQPRTKNQKGSGLLGFTNTLKLIEKGQYVKAADNALKSKWAREDTPKRAARVTDWIRNA